MERMVLDIFLYEYLYGQPHHFSGEVTFGVAGLPQILHCLPRVIYCHWMHKGMVLASRASGCLFGHPKPLKSTPQDTQKILWGISLNVNLKHEIEFFHHHIIPMTLYKDIMPYFDEYIHVYVWNLSRLWSPLKMWTPKNFTMANFRHPLSNSWLRHCIRVLDKTEKLCVQNW